MKPISLGTLAEQVLGCAGGHRPLLRALCVVAVTGTMPIISGVVQVPPGHSSGAGMRAPRGSAQPLPWAASRGPAAPRSRLS